MDDFGGIVIPLGGKTAPEEVELLPAGRIETRPMDGRAPYLNDRPEAVVAATARNGLELPIDYEHQTLFAPENGQPAPASGWISETFVRDGAVWGKVRWTERAKAAIEAEEYRYLSPVFAHTHDATRRVLRIDQAALTNEPGFYMRALARAAARANRRQEEDVMDIKDLLKALGIPETSTDEQIRAAASAMVAASASGAIALSALGVEATAAEADIRAAATARAGAGVTQAEYDRVVAENTSLKTQRADELAAAEGDAAIADGKLAPAQKDWGLSYAKANPEGFRAFAKAAPKIVKEGRLPDPDKAGAPDVGMALPPGYTADEDRAALHGRAMARASRDKIPYIRAVELEAQEQ